MDRRLPPSHRSSSSSSPARAGRYSSIRSSSASGASSNAANSSDYYENTTYGASTGASSSSAVASSFKGGVDTTTTIDGTRSNVSGGMSTYERYRSLQSTKPSPTSSTTIANTSAEVPSSSLERQARSSARMSATRSDSFSKRSASPIRELRKQRLQQQYTSSGTSGRSSSFKQSSPLRASSPGQSIPRSSNSSSFNDKNEEWLDHIRKTSEAYDDEAARDKKIKKVKKSSRQKSNRKLLSSVVSEDVGSADESKLRKSGRQRSSRKLVASSVTAPSPDGETRDKEKKKKKRSKSKKSSTNYGSSSDDGSVDEEVFSSAPQSARGTTIGEEPAIQAALSKLGGQNSPQEPHIDGAALARARIYAAKRDPTMSSSSYTQQHQTATVGDGALARAQANSALTASTPPSVPDRTGFGSSQGAARARVRSATGIGSTPIQPPDEKMSTMDSAVRGWSTFRGRHSRNNSIANPFATRSSTGEGSKVSEYLNSRKSISGDNPAANSYLAEREKAAQAAKLATHPATPEGDGSTFFSGASQSESLVSGTSDEEDGFSSSSSGTDDEMPSDHPEWSVRVCVISAIDLPANVVPTVPFSPLLKVGLVGLKNKVESGSEENGPDRLKHSIHSFGLTGVSKARVRSTSAKVVSRRDNGSVEFQEEMRWDSHLPPNDMALAIELSARAVMTPSNYKESPYEQAVKPLDFQGSRFGIRDSSSGRAGSEGRVSLFRRGVQKNPSSEMELAKAAAAVAKHLVEGQEGKQEEDAAPSSPSKTTKHQSSSEINVKLLNKEKKRKPRLTDDIRLGSQLVPLSKLAWEKALKNNEATRIEQWFELETSASPIVMPGGKSTRNPSVLLEISFSAPAILDDSEDDLEEEGAKTERKKGASYSRRAAISIRSQLRKETRSEQKPVKEQEPVLEPGVIDYVCVVGASNIGDQKSDDGASGWVNTTPETCVMEQFPPTQEYHSQNGRNVALPDKVEWFCFPEGCKLWRGTTPPNAEELNLVRFSASSPANVATTIASFDACLGCTSSFSWFVLASNSDEYGSANQKIYGACIRFFVPAPTGIDPTQDDFGQAIRGAALDDKASKRLWVPMALCITSQLPIVGTMEVMLLRMCETLSAMVGNEGQTDGLNHFFKDVASTVVTFQKPIPGVVSSSIPFLGGDPLCLTLPPSRGLPPLPHGAAITSVCRLLGANGINFLLAAMLTECKILLHSEDIGNLCLVAEVMTALLYPFTWSLPYIPVLPISMMEFIEAPLSYLLGIPTSCLKLVNRECLEDVVVIDLDKDFSGASGLVDDAGRNSTANVYSKVPTPLPASTAANVSKAVYRLLQYNDEGDDADDGGRQSAYGKSRSFPRLHRETQVEREFRISIALEIAGLVRGYNDHLVIGPSNQPMFNVDKFLQTAPILFDEQRGNSLTASSALRVLSPRSRRFISILVTCQHFHQFLEVSSSESLGFFRKVMGELEAYGTKRDLLAVKRVLSLDAQKTIDQLSAALSRIEDKIPVYAVERSEKFPETLAPDVMDAAQIAASDFPYSLLRPISTGNGSEDSVSRERAEGVNQISLEYLVELEKNPWRYQPLLPIELGARSESGFEAFVEKVKLRDAIGERKYMMWKNAAERGDEEEAMFHEEAEGNQTLDWTELLSENAEESPTSEGNPQDESVTHSSKRRLADAKDRDSLRRCLEQARVAGNPTSDAEADPGRDLVSEAETALRSQSARRFLLSILNKRSSEASESGDKSNKKSPSSGVSKLEEGAFEVLLRLGCAMLDACIEDRDYDTAYALLKLTAGLYSSVGNSDPPVMLYMTQRLGHHPIYADLGVWLTAKKMHLTATVSSESNKGTQGSQEADEYEAAVATLYEMLGYGIPAEELARFASRVSEENGWFGSERGQSLLLLARRICMRRDAGVGSQKTTSDIEMMSPTTSMNNDSGSTGVVADADTDETWTEIGWIHPSAQYSSRFEKDVKRKEKKEGSKSSHMKRSAITSMAYLGSSVVVTGSLDGGVFLARGTHETGEDGSESQIGVRGIHLDWGSSGSRFTATSSSTATDGAYGVGAVSVVAATLPANQSYDALQMTPKPSTKSVTDAPDEEELVAAMEGCRVVAGTSCGDLRVWSVKDVLSAVFFANRGSEASNGGVGAEERTVHRSGEGASSSIIGNRRRSSEFATGSSLTRLKFSLRGRALSGHRGGVSCVDVPSHVYRPDSIISGGADGLIKLWSLRSSGSSGRSRLEPDQYAFGPTASQDQLSSKGKATSRSGDAMSILSGHGGRILCVKSAWHGDRLLSGGADRTVRLWDLAGSGGKCLSSLSGHFGWVTSVKYWGPNTIISASTDRSIALWDARVRNAPLFTLRHHYAPISDILVGSRTDPIMISAGGDGTIAAWDFRRLSDPSSQSRTSQDRQCKVIRRPAGKLYLHEFSSRRRTFGPVLLSRGPCTNSKTVSCLGRDAITREWDIKSGEIVSEHVTGHCDTISSFASLEGDRLHDPQAETSGGSAVTGTVTTSWDGSVRIRKRS